jgi:arylsulfatase A-like enzyme
MILTSDHGQAFGEHGMVWHGVRTDEEMLRVPLFLRLPRNERAGATGAGWASPLDTVPTVLEAVRAPRTSPASGFPLQSLVESERPTPLMSAGDGTEWNRPFMETLSPQRRLELNLFSIAAYVGSTKIVVDATTTGVRGYDLSSDPLIELPPIRLDRPDLGAVIQQARQAAATLLHPKSTGASEEVDERLRSWGYG